MQQWRARRVYWCGLKNCSVRVDADGAVAAHHDLPLADLARKPRLVTNSSIWQRGIVPRASFGRSADSFPPCSAAIPSCGGSLFVMMDGRTSMPSHQSALDRRAPPHRTATYSFRAPIPWVIRHHVSCLILLRYFLHVCVFLSLFIAFRRSVLIGA